MAVPEHLIQYSSDLPTLLVYSCDKLASQVHPSFRALAVLPQVHEQAAVSLLGVTILSNLGDGRRLDITGADQDLSIHRPKLE